MIGPTQINMSLSAMSRRAKINTICLVTILLSKMMIVQA